MLAGFEGEVAMHILVVEDDLSMQQYLVQGLTQAGHAVTTCGDGAEGLSLAREGRHDLLILDRMLPGLDGVAVLQALRSSGSTLPVLMLSALGEVDHRVEGLQAGADDYLSKPFSFQELTARVEALHRRRQSGSETITELRIGDLSLDLIGRHARRGGQLIELWPLEFRLLEYLLRNANQTVTRTMLLENVWNLHFDPQTNVVEVHMSRLRAKVDRPFPQRLIHTIRGEGYVIREP